MPTIETVDDLLARFRDREIRQPIDLGGMAYQAETTRLAAILEFLEDAGQEAGAILAALVDPKPSWPTGYVQAVVDAAVTARLIATIYCLFADELAEQANCMLS